MYFSHLWFSIYIFSLGLFGSVDSNRLCKGLEKEINFFVQKTAHLKKQNMQIFLSSLNIMNLFYKWNDSFLSTEAKLYKKLLAEIWNHRTPLIFWAIGKLVSDISIYYLTIPTTQ